ncbi:hypothetical protein KCU99_g367, partial [Aureobasidium melanogenum]
MARRTQPVVKTVPPHIMNHIGYVDRIPERYKTPNLVSHSFEALKLGCVKDSAITTISSLTSCLPAYSSAISSFPILFILSPKEAPEDLATGIALSSRHESLNPFVCPALTLKVTVLPWREGKAHM